MVKLELKIEKLECSKFIELLDYLNEKGYESQEGRKNYIHFKGVDKMIGFPPVYQGVKLEYNSGMPNEILRGLMFIIDNSS